MTSNRLMLMGFGLLSAVFIGCAGAGTAFIAWVITMPVPPPVVLEQPAIPRHELYKAVMGKSEDQVIKILGKPDKVAASRYIENNFTWTYHKRSCTGMNPKTIDVPGVDNEQELVFLNGEVVSVFFNGVKAR